MRGHLRVTLGSVWQEPGSVSKAAATRRRIVGEEGILPTRVRVRAITESTEPIPGLPSPRAQGTPSSRPGVRPFRCSRGRGVSETLPRSLQVRSGMASPLSGNGFARFDFCSVERKSVFGRKRKAKTKTLSQRPFLDNPARRAAGKRPGRSGGERLIIAASLDFGLGRLRFGR